MEGGVRDNDVRRSKRNKENEGRDRRVNQKLWLEEK